MQIYSFSPHLTVIHIKKYYLRSQLLWYKTKGMEPD